MPDSLFNVTCGASGAPSRPASGRLRPAGVQRAKDAPGVSCRDRRRSRRAQKDGPGRMRLKQRAVDRLAQGRGAV